MAFYRKHRGKGQERPMTPTILATQFSPKALRYLGVQVENPPRLTKGKFIKILAKHPHLFFF